MKHEPYRSWLLAEGNLAAGKRAALADHLAECESCRQLRAAWGQVHARLARSATLPPQEGFAARFARRLQAQRQQGQRRQAWLVFTLALLGSLAAMALWAPLAVTRAGSASVDLLTELLALRSQLTVLGDLLFRLPDALPAPAGDLTRASLLVALAGALVALYASLGALWTAAVFRFVNPTSSTGGSK